jgi:4'-phosphopantetheinyl transferase EntD
MSSEAPFSANIAKSNPAVPSPAIASLFPPVVAAAELRARGDVALLDPSERAALGRAIESRAREFAAGRLCARRALAQLGLEQPVPAASDRQPIWPRGIVGSITHTEGIAAAVVAPRALLAAIGLDTERASRVKRELWPKICLEEEIAWLESIERAERAAAAALIFAAKEAFYKCQYPCTSQWLYFGDVHVTAEWGGPMGSIRVAPTRAIALFATGGIAANTSSLMGRFRLHEGLVSVGVCVPASSRAAL